MKPVNVLDKLLCQQHVLLAHGMQNENRGAVGSQGCKGQDVLQ